VIIAVDFDGTVVHAGPPLRLMPGAREALSALRRAGHVLLLHSARANRAGRFNAQLDPLVRAGVRSEVEDPVDRMRAHRAHDELFHEMCRFVAVQLPGLFHAIDDGQQGKPWVDLFIDDKSVNPESVGGAFARGWDWVASTYGAPASRPLMGALRSRR
jgi:hypothetical protein